MKMSIRNGKIEGKFNILPLLLSSGKISKIGNGYHVLIKKEDAEAIGEGKKIGIMLFEYNGKKGGEKWLREEKVQK